MSLFILYIGIFLSFRENKKQIKINSVYTFIYNSAREREREYLVKQFWCEFFYNNLFYIIFFLPLVVVVKKKKEDIVEMKVGLLGAGKQRIRVSARVQLGRETYIPRA